VYPDANTLVAKNNTDKNAPRRRNLDILPTFFFSLHSIIEKTTGPAQGKKHPPYNFFTFDNDSTCVEKKKFCFSPHTQALEICFGD